LARVDSKEIAEWQAYYKINPFGEIRDDMRMARICSILYNSWRGKGSQSMSESDFMFEFGKAEKTVDEDMVKAMFGVK